MIVGVPKEIKNNENRVSLTPASVQELVKRGHKVYVETNAGIGSGIANEEYVAVGAEILGTPKEVFDIADIIVKVKEPLASEYPLFKEGQALYTYLHLAPNKELTEALMEKKVMGIAYETVEAPNGSLPLLVPMSEVAGRMSTQVGATLLQKYNKGRGMLLGGVPGVPPANVVVIGGGVVGTNAAKMAIGMGANVTIFDINAERMAYLDDIFANRIHTCYSNSLSLGEALKTADLVIGAVLIPGAKAPCLVTEEMVKTMKEGSVIVDVAIDQGGSIETIDRVTTHDNPSYVTHGVVHYSVANMPGAVPRTSTFALNGATLKHLIALVEKGPEQALKDDPMLMKGLNTYKGYVTYKAVADDLNLEYRDPYTLI